MIDHDIEFIEDEHIYLIDGVIVPSVTQMLKKRFGNKYTNVPQRTLENASKKGTEVHKAIELYDTTGKDSELIELRNYKFLKRMYEFETVDNELMVVLHDADGKPIACGTLDLLIKENGKLGIGDIKRTAVLDKEYLAYQLNLYRIAYMQCYGEEIEFLRALHLRDHIRKYIDIPINEDIAWDLVKEYFNEKEY